MQLPDVQILWGRILKQRWGCKKIVTGMPGHQESVRMGSDGHSEHKAKDIAYSEGWCGLHPSLFREGNGLRVPSERWGSMFSEEAYQGFFSMLPARLPHNYSLRSSAQSHISLNNHIRSPSETHSGTEDGTMLRRTVFGRNGRFSVVPVKRAVMTLWGGWRYKKQV